MTASLKRVLIILVCLSVLYCAPKREIIRPEVVTPAMLLKRANLNGIDTLMASLKIMAYNDRDYLGVYPGHLFFKRPDQLKISIHGPFGITLMELAFRKGAVLLFIPTKDTTYTGNLPINKLLPDTEELLSMEYQIRLINSEYLLLFYNGYSEKSPKAIYRFDGYDLSWKGLEIYNPALGHDRREDKVVLKLSIFKMEDNLPRDLEIITGSYRFRITLDSTKINPLLKEDLFSIPVASKVRPLKAFRGWLEQ